MPNEFEMILGVSGTLEVMSDIEKKIISEEYGINKITYSPSVYGNSNLIFNSRDDINILEEDQFYNFIINNINDNLKNEKGKRAVIIFFENIEKLEMFEQSEKFR